MKGTHKQIRKVIILLFWLGIWQAAALLADNPILLAGPFQVLRAFVDNLMRPDFIFIVLHSLAGIGLGFFLALFAGMLLGAAGYRMTWAEELLAPMMAVFKSVPVASFVVLLLIWFGSGRLSFWISFLIVLPNVYVNTLAGLKSTDSRLLEMARVFGMGRGKKFFYIYRPALMPCIGSCLKISLGMSWKSGVAAEIIGLSEASLGERLYMSKIYLDTAGLFAWTVTIVLVSFLFEKAVLGVFRLFAGWHPYPFFGWRECYQGNLFSDVDKKSRWKEAGIQQQERIHTQNSIQMLHIEKSYNGQSVIRDFNLKMERGGRYLLMAPSGAGKTTLLKILTGLEQADRGEIAGMAGRIGMVFQEDRLCEEYDAVCNILLGMEKSRNLLMKSCGSDSMSGKQFQRQLIEYVRAQAVRILPEDCLTKPVGNLSGGMRRRVSLLRAVLSGADILIMDEPFTGLDEENRARSAAYLMEQLQGRTLLATTHREEDVDLLRGKKIYC